MIALKNKITSSPTLVRVVPFLIFLLLTLCQGKFGEASRYWFYFAKTIAGAGMLWVIWPFIPEMRWKFSWEAVVVGVGVLVMWIGLDGYYPSTDQMTQKYFCPVLRWIGLESWCPKPAEIKPWNPHQQFGFNSTLAWVFIIGRLLGSTFVVPPLEEVFYRSFVYRYIIKQNIASVPLGQFNWTAFLVTSVIFGLAHHEWLAGILCGFAYQGLVCRKKRLGDAMTAHAITNFLLGLWIIWKEDWKFW